MPRKYKIHLTGGWEEVSGWKVPCDDRLFIHASNFGWKISHVNTGCLLCSGFKTRFDAAKAARKLVAMIPDNKTKVLSSHNASLIRKILTPVATTWIAWVSKNIQRTGV